ADQNGVDLRRIVGENVAFYRRARARHGHSLARHDEETVLKLAAEDAIVLRAAGADPQGALRFQGPMRIKQMSPQPRSSLLFQRRSRGRICPDSRSCAR